MNLTFLENWTVWVNKLFMGYKAMNYLPARNVFLEDKSSLLPKFKCLLICTHKSRF